jgi:hypothetical protein
MDEMLVTLPYARLRAVALYLGGQGTNACPMTTTTCWSKRGITARYFTEIEPIDAECAECWLTFLMQGV